MNFDPTTGEAGADRKKTMANCKKNPVRRTRRTERSERERRALLEMPDFMLRLFGAQRLRGAESAIVLRHWHD